MCLGVMLPINAKNAGQRLDQLIAQNKIIIFSTTTCPSSTKVKALFDESNVEKVVVELDQIEDGQHLKEALEKRVNQTVVPQVFINGQYVGGYYMTRKVMLTEMAKKVFHKIDVNKYNYALIKYGENDPEDKVVEQCISSLDNYCKSGKSFIAFSTYKYQSDIERNVLPLTWLGYGPDCLKNTRINSIWNPLSNSILNPPLTQSRRDGPDSKWHKIKSYKTNSLEGIGDRDLSILVTEHPFIQELRISGAGNVSEVGITYICEDLDKLKKLSLNFNTEGFVKRVTGKALSKLKGITSLSLHTNQPNAPILQCLEYLSRGEGRFLSELTVTVEEGVAFDPNILEFISKHFLHLNDIRYLVPNSNSKEIINNFLNPNCASVDGLRGFYLTQLGFRLNSSLELGFRLNSSLDKYKYPMLKSYLDYRNFQQNDPNELGIRLKWNNVISDFLRTHNEQMLCHIIDDYPNTRRQHKFLTPSGAFTQTIHGTEDSLNPIDGFDRDVSNYNTTHNVLVCGDGNISEVGIRYICQQFKYLEELEIHFDKQEFADGMTGESLNRLKYVFQHLSLHLMDARVPLLQYLQHLSTGNGKYLTELNIRANAGNETEGNYLDFINDINFPSLKRLCHLVPQNLLRINQLSANLTHLEFDSNSETLDDNAMHDLLTKCVKLESLIIRYEETEQEKLTLNLNFNEKAILLPRLLKFEFHALNGTYITDTAIQQFMLKISERLHSIVFESIYNLSDQTVNKIIASYLARRIETLTSLNLINCPLVSKEVIDELKYALDVNIQADNPKELIIQLFCDKNTPSLN